MDRPLYHPSTDRLAIGSTVAARSRHGDGTQPGEILGTVTHLIHHDREPAQEVTGALVCWPCNGACWRGRNCEGWHGQAYGREALIVIQPTGPTKHTLREAALADHTGDHTGPLGQLIPDGAQPSEELIALVEATAKAAIQRTLLATGDTAAPNAAKCRAHLRRWAARTAPVEV